MKMNKKLKELYEKKKIIDFEIHSLQQDRLLQQLKLNQYYVGKCYKQKIIPAIGEDYFIYFKVIEEHAGNEWRISVLKFPEHPRYCYQPKVDGDGITGKFKSYFIELDDILIDRLRNYEEIDEKEFFNKMDNFIEELKRMNFNIHHADIG